MQSLFWEGQWLAARLRRNGSTCQSYPSLVAVMALVAVAALPPYTTLTQRRQGYK